MSDFSQTDPFQGILNLMRQEGERRSVSDPEGVLVAGDVSKLILARLDRLEPTTPADALRFIAVAIGAIRQTFLSDNHLSARELDESMPVLRHLSAVAEELVGLSDGLASVSFSSALASDDGTFDDLPPLDEMPPDGTDDGFGSEW